MSDPSYIFSHSKSLLTPRLPLPLTLLSPSKVTINALEPKWEITFLLSYISSLTNYSGPSPFASHSFFCKLDYKMWAIVSFILGCTRWALRLCDTEREQTASQQNQEHSPSAFVEDRPLVRGGSTDNPNPAAERLAAKRLAAERLEAEGLAAERLGAEKLEAERLGTEKLEAKRLETERLEAERLETERLAAERQEAERLETGRQEVERLEAEGLEIDRLTPLLQINAKLRNMIRDQRKGLQKMYGETEAELDKSLWAPSKRGEEMARKLINEMGCAAEVAKDLTVLTLYDVAILIGTF